jgi:hypothetical protein
MSLQILLGFPHADEMADVGGSVFGADAGAVGFDGFCRDSDFSRDGSAGLASDDTFENSRLGRRETIEESLQIPL